MEGETFYCKKCNDYFTEDHFLIYTKNQGETTVISCRLNNKTLNGTAKRKPYAEHNRYVDLRRNLYNYGIDINSREYHYNAEIMIKYKLLPEQYNKMFLEQQGCCKICGRHQDEIKKKLHVDHCHETGEIRGLLCHNCNHGLGNFKDNMEFLQKAIDYLKPK